MTKNVGGAAGLTWTKSSYSAGDGGQCVEVAVAFVRIRDSKRADGPVLTVGSAGWEQFVRMAASA